MIQHTDPFEKNPLADHCTPAPLSPATLDEYEEVAKNIAGIRGRMFRLGIVYQRAVAEEHRAQVSGEAEARAAALFKRCETAGRIDAALDAFADDWLSGFALAVERRPHELAELAEKLLGPSWDNLQSELAEQAAAIVRMEGGAA